MLHGPWVADMLSTYFTGKTVKAMAMTSAHVPAVGTTYRASLTGELSGGGYVAGGVAVNNVTAMWDLANARAYVTCDPVNFGSVTATDVGAVVFYIDTGSAATDRVLWTDTFPSIAAEGALTYEPDPAGAMEIQL